MKLKIVLLLIVFLNLAVAFGQEKIWIQQTKIGEVIAFEKEINPHVEFLKMNVSLSKDIYPLADRYKVTNPIIAKREALGYLPVYVEYFYTPLDSILRVVSYDWEKGRYDNYFDKQKIWKEERTKFKTYNKEYERIKENLLPSLGKPVSMDVDAKTVTDDGRSYLERNTVWDTPDFYAELTMIFSESTFRIRLHLYWKK